MLTGGTMGIKFCLSLAKCMGKYVTALGYNQVSSFEMCAERRP